MRGSAIAPMALMSLPLPRLTVSGITYRVMGYAAGLVAPALPPPFVAVLAIGRRCATLRELKWHVCVRM